MVDILNINFERVTFWCILFLSSILISVNLIDINMCKVLILHEMCYLVYKKFTPYDNNKTKVWQEILITITLAFSREAVHEKL